MGCACTANILVAPLSEEHEISHNCNTLCRPRALFVISQSCDSQTELRLLTLGAAGWLHNRVPAKLPVDPSLCCPRRAFMPPYVSPGLPSSFLLLGQSAGGWLADELGLNRQHLPRPGARGS